jgi:hypothetical protein
LATLLLERIRRADNRWLDSLIRTRGGEPSFLKRLTYRQSAKLTLGGDGLGHALIKNISVGMFLLMPLFALLLKVFYRRQRPLYVQHLIFSINLHSFFFLFFSFLMLLAMVLPEDWKIPPGIPVLATWAYWVLALSRFSGQSIKRSLWKGSLLFSGYVGVLAFFATGVVVLSLLFF